MTKKIVFFFIYGSHFYNKKNNNYNFNANINKEIFCYKLNYDLNIIKWKSDNQREINYKIAKYIYN